MSWGCGVRSPIFLAEETGSDRQPHYASNKAGDCKSHSNQKFHRSPSLGAKKLKLDEDTRWQIAGEAIEELRRYGGWQALDEEAPTQHPGPRH